MGRKSGPPKGTWVDVFDRLPAEEGIYNVRIGKPGATSGFPAKKIFRPGFGWSASLPPPFEEIPGEVQVWWESEEAENEEASKGAD